MLERRKFAMRETSRIRSHSFVSLVFVVFLAAVTSQAQGREQYLISVKAGGVNSVSGDVRLKLKNAPTWQPLSSQDDLSSGDAVRTGMDGRVEVLLNPGSYLRAAENSEFELTDISLDTLRIKLNRGSAIMEVAGAYDARTPLEIVAPQTTTIVDKKGLYRINILPSAATEVLVRRGQALIVNGSVKPERVKDGKKVVVSGGKLAVGKFDKDDQDVFDLWSAQRARTLVAANRKLSNRAIATAWTSYRNDRRGLQSGYGSSVGLWIYDPFLRGRTFLPFNNGWASPYGHSFSHGFGLSVHNSPHGLALGGTGHGGISIGLGGGHGIGSTIGIGHAARSHGISLGHGGGHH